MQIKGLNRHGLHLKERRHGLSLSLEGGTNAHVFLNKIDQLHEVLKRLAANNPPAPCGGVRHPFEIPRCKGAGTGHMGIVCMKKAKVLTQRIKTLQLRMRLHGITLKHIHGIFEHPWVP